MSDSDIPKQNATTPPAASAARSAAPFATAPAAPSIATPAPAPVAKPPPLPNPLAHLDIPFQSLDYSTKGYHLDAKVEPDQVVRAATQLDQEGFALDTITGVDLLAEGQIEVVYDYFRTDKALRVVVRARI